MSTINVDIVNPQSGNNVTVSGVAIDSPTTNSIAVGTNALASVTTGLRNIAIGTDALSSITTGNNSVAIGNNALKNWNNVNVCVAVGTDSLMSNIVGTQNTAFGFQTLKNTTAANNSAFGHNALNNNLAGTGNAAFGSLAATTFTSGGSNTFIGFQAGYALASGNNNIFVGVSGVGPTFLSSGDNNILIGNIAQPSTPIVNDEITLGNSANTVLRCAVTSITSLSDSRDKEEVAELAVGLEFVKELNPVSFVWNDRNESGKHGVKDFGFIAQDLKSTQEKYEMAETLGLVYEANPEKLEASYGKLIPILVQAIKELSAKVEALENK
jgi:hypothetical protein